MGIIQIVLTIGRGKKDETPVCQQWSYTFHALTFRYINISRAPKSYIKRTKKHSF